MPKMTVKWHSILKKEAVDRTEQHDVDLGTTVREGIEGFAKDQPVSPKERAASAQGQKPWESQVVMLNGTGLSPEKQLTTRVKQGDSVTVYLPVSGVRAGKEVMEASIVCNPFCQ